MPSLHVLVVEDEAPLRELLVEILREEGCTVSEAPNGKVALARLAVSAPDVILTDLMMPEMNGWELIAELRAQPHLAAIPVVVLTSFADTTPIAGVRTVAKPMDLSTLLGLLEAVVPARGAAAADGARRVTAESETP